MKAVGIKKLKNELSRYLQLVRQGEIVLALDRDEVVAEIRKPAIPASGSTDRWEAVLGALEAEGSVRRATSPDGSLSELVGRRPPVPDAADIIDDARDDRF